MLNADPDYISELTAQTASRLYDIVPETDSRFYTTFAEAAVGIATRMTAKPDAEFDIIRHDAEGSLAFQIAIWWFADALDRELRGNKHASSQDEFATIGPIALAYAGVVFSVYNVLTGGNDYIADEFSFPTEGGFKQDVIETRAAEFFDNFALPALKTAGSTTPRHFRF